MELSQDNIKEILLEFICRHFIVERSQIDMDESLVDQGIIDSLGLVEIVSFITKKFNISIVEQELIRQNFGSVNKLVAFIVSKIAMRKETTSNAAA
ncbi:MAG: acyl carrier protein [Chitinivibrionales bacterium]|nr:acyl carrier protein [Chitinivibrionales bacterium]